MVSCLLCLIGEELRDLVTTLRRLNATEMIRAADAAGLRSSLATDNITVFAPINAAFDALHPPTTVALLPHVSRTLNNRRLHCGCCHWQIYSGAIGCPFLTKRFEGTPKSVSVNVCKKFTTFTRKCRKSVGHTS